jgi:hypothetical protein
MKRRRTTSVSKLVEAGHAFFSLCEEDQDWVLEKMAASVPFAEIRKQAEAEGRLRWRAAS